FGLIRDFTERAGFRGQIDIDLFEKDDKVYFSEVNPRYGGGYPHAYYAGADMPSMYINNLQGIENHVSIGAYRDGVVMMKYNETRIIESSEVKKWPES
ncbi:MAG: carbamoyl phosphate synthase, partial [Clostridia bacterium]|nr:carbamoyl phosphate synthase [Clostridia bacterium]